MEARLATSSDVDRLVEFGSAAFIRTFGYLYKEQDLNCYMKETYNLANFRKYIEDPIFSTSVAVFNSDDGSEIVGYCICSGKADLPHPDITNKCFEIMKLYVHPSHFGKGTAQSLMDMAMRWIESHADRGDTWVSVWSENYRAQKFYNRYGFTFASEYGYRVGDHIDREFIYRKRTLKPPLDDSILRFALKLDTSKQSRNLKINNKFVNEDDKGWGEADGDDMHSQSSRSGNDRVTCTLLAERHRKDGCELAESGDYSGALRQWDESLRLDAQCAFTHELKAQVYLETGKYLLAVTSAERAVELDEAWGEGRLTLARAQREMGEVDKSIETYRQALLLLFKERASSGNEEGDGEQEDGSSGKDLYGEAARELEELEEVGVKLAAFREMYAAEGAASGCTNSPSTDIEASTCLYNLSARVHFPR